LRAAGIESTDRVVLLATTSAVSVASYLAVLGLGAVAVPVNPESPPAELERELAVVRPRLVLRDSDELEEVSPAAVVDVDDGALAVLLFTAGTAGAPRAAMLTHGCLAANTEQLQALDSRLRPEDVVLGALPLFHIFGLGAVLGTALAAGASVVLERRFDPAATVALVANERVTVVPGAPPLWAALAACPDVPDGAFATVRQAVSGAAALDDAVAAEVERRFGVVVREGYGLTEASPVVTTSVDVPPRRGSVGKVLPGVEVRLVDGDGDDVLEGDPGEIWVRGANVFAGYWEDPAATARVLDGDGWLHTGDVAVVDGDGYLYLVDRSKDIIIVSGFNVYPAEVEDVLGSAPGVAEVAVVGEPDRTTGEAGVAYVVSVGGAPLDRGALTAWCREHLARYKCPARIEVVERLPKGLTGKVLRRLLR
jgi:long-chain acyl-CoA synthetase